MGTPEPEYCDDPFSDRDMSIDNAGIIDRVLCKHAFLSCGRTRFQFKTDPEAARWRRIDKAVDCGDIPKAWVYDRCTYATKYRMSLPRLMSAILNAGKMEEWMNENKISSGGAITQEIDQSAIKQD